MNIYIKIVIVLILIVAPSLWGADSYAKGSYGQVTKDGSIDTSKIDESDKHHLFGFPAFKSWSLSGEATDSKLLLEGEIISTNTGMTSQGVKVYVQYGELEPFLLAIADADGKIKMQLQRTRDLRGVPQSLKRVYIVRAYMRSSNILGAIARGYTIHEQRPATQSAERGGSVQPATASQSKPEASSESDLVGVAGEPDLSKRTLPTLRLEEAIDIAEAFIEKQKIEKDGKFLSRVQYHENNPWTKPNPKTKTSGPYWQITYEPDIHADGGEVFILIYMDGVARYVGGM